MKKMGSKNSVIFLIVCLTLIGGSLSQNNPDNYVKLKNQAETIEYKFTGSVEDFSQLHSAPLGPLSYGFGTDVCYKGVHGRYIERNYSSIGYTYSSKEEICYSESFRGYNSLRLLGSADSKFVHLYAEEYTAGGPQLSYNTDMANITLSNTNSLLVVGEGLSATFYTLPNYGGASVCVTVGTNPYLLFNIIDRTTVTFGFNTIRSFKFGCNSKKFIQPLEFNILDIIN